MKKTNYKVVKKKYISELTHYIQRFQLYNPQRAIRELLQDDSVPAGVYELKSGTLLLP